VAGCVAICGGSMSFKFKIGTTVYNPNGDDELYQVIGLMLNGYINLRSLSTRRPLVAEAKHYERFQEKISEPDNQNPERTTRGRIETVPEHQSHEH